MQSHTTDKKVIDQIREAWAHGQEEGHEPEGGVVSKDMADRLLSESPDEVIPNPLNLNELTVDGLPITVLDTPK